MKKICIFVIVALVMVGVVAPMSTHAQGDASSHLGRKIIIWKQGTDENNTHAFAERHGKLLKHLSFAHASVVDVSSVADLQALTSFANVERVDDDPIATITNGDERDEREGNYRTNTNINATARSGAVVSIQAAQPTPWGIAAINAPQVWVSGNTADPIKVGVIDTGISLGHPDLKANIKGGINTINPRRSPDDDNGHGSHVAGIIAALNNTQGVVGGAPLADLYAIKVLNSAGSGYYSDIIEGLQWAVANHMQVVNMSLGGTADYQPLHDAIIAAKNAGVTIVAAAGNSGGAVIYPAAYPETIAVSATDASNNIASWSSRGPEVDLAAPGVNIYSTYKGTSYATLSGTSMAAPHVAASAALVLGTPVGSSDTNGDGVWNPSEVLAKLEGTATDLGASGFDTLFGFGLVNVFAATH